MSEDERVRSDTEEPEDEVEAHQHGGKRLGNEEPQAEGENDEVEAHGSKKL